MGSEPISWPDGTRTLVGSSLHCPQDDAGDSEDISQIQGLAHFQEVTWLAVLLQQSLVPVVSTAACLWQLLCRLVQSALVNLASPAGCFQLIHDLCYCSSVAAALDSLNRALSRNPEILRSHWRYCPSWLRRAALIMQSSFYLALLSPAIAPHHS
jgi:hypothetical protein